MTRMRPKRPPPMTNISTSNPLAPGSVSAATAARSKSSKRCCCRSGGASLLVAIVAISALFFLWVTWKWTRTPPPSTQLYTFDIVNEFPHDPDAFTQGLVYGGNETLFESTGLYSKSSVREVLLQTGKVMVSHQMDASFFGEGLTLFGERLYQVTWLTNTGFIYDRHNIREKDRFTHPMSDGWGLATDGKILYATDGTSTLYHLDPQTLKEIRRVTVKYNDHEIPFLNELEYVDGEVWANVWQTDCIARISHEDGKVLSWIALHELRQGLMRSGYTGIDVLNGIAWDDEKKRLFVTGKLWPKLYQIKFRPVTDRLNRRIEDLCYP
ncbi:glutaminyl-peptide cyclotransferase-like [Zingiber officinale]|uniref:glutaminyl-peptide cyclotransferase-like n=1 Tax=Zingiber officinale TaxID=94328 RepID=UPI001C4B6E43|nr:glutaminyl-peptide cyclotransferase-like [Zingiber officinale]